MTDTLDGETFKKLHELNEAIDRPIPKDESGTDPEHDEEKKRERDMKKKHLFQLLEELFGELD